MSYSTYGNRRHRHDTCNDQVVGAILSGWRYDISGIAPELRGDYEDHLAGCAHCRGRQRLHRTVDVLLLAVTTLSFAAFLLVALVMHRLEAVSHVGALHLHLLPEKTAIQAHIPASITISLQTVAIAGVFISMALWVLIAIATPLPGMFTEFRQRATGGRDRLRKQAA